MPPSLRILLRFLLTIVLIWAMKTYLGTWFVVTGGWPAYIIIAALITLMNIFVLPVLNLLAAPLKFLMTAVAVLLVNGIFLWLTVRIVSWMEDRKSTRLNSSHSQISYAVFCLKK